MTAVFQFLCRDVSVQYYFLTTEAKQTGAVKQKKNCKVLIHINSGSKNSLARKLADIYLTGH
ncbi:hypothetical protein CRM79_22100 [Pantoea agglomerans]|nr:hypothetical protein CRM79_22100 [Pantoea agglomerans]